MAPKTPQGSGPRAIAARQNGVIDRGQMIDAGYSTEAIKHRIRRGRLFRIYQGVYAVGRRELSQEGEWQAALLACGPTAALSHDSAGQLWGIAKGPPTPIHVSVLVDCRSREGIRTHRRTELRTTTRKGLRTTTPAQTLVDLAACWPRDPIEQAIGEAQLRRLISLKQLRKAGADGGKPGAKLRAIIEDVTFRVTQSELEREFLRLLKSARLPFPETQRRFGKHRVDFHWPDLGLVIEADGGNFHRTARQQQYDRERDQAHIRAGRTPMRVTHGQVFNVKDEITALLADVVRRLGATGDAERQRTRRLL